MLLQSITTLQSYTNTILPNTILPCLLQSITTPANLSQPLQSY